MEQPWDVARAWVSVIVPVYNVRPYIEQALDSLAGQTHGALEILLVDDGSTDGSGEVCERYGAADPRIRVIHQPNRGLSAARNTGLDAMTGDFVAFLDPDDAFHPEMIGRLLQELEDPEVDIAACGVGILEGRDVNPPPVPGRWGRARAMEHLLRGTAVGIVVWNKLYRARLFDGLRFPEGRVYEDVATTYRLLDRCRAVAVIPDKLALHRRRPGSISQTVTPASLRDLYTAHQERLDFFRRNVPKRYDARLLRLVSSNMEDSRIGSWNRLSLNTDAESRAYLRQLRREILRHRGDLLAPTVKRRLCLALIALCPPLGVLANRLYHPIKQRWLRR